MVARKPRRLTLCAGLVIAVVAVGPLVGCGGESPAGRSDGAEAPGTSEAASATTSPATEAVAPNTAGPIIAAEMTARASALKVAPDVVLMSLDSRGAVSSPPPASWNFLYASQQKGRIYRVVVSNGTASQAQDVARLNREPSSLEKAAAITTVTVGPKEAYEAARTFLERRDGNVPPNVMMSMDLIELPLNFGDRSGDWVLWFMKGDDASSAKKVLVDGKTATATPLE